MEQLQFVQVGSVAIICLLIGQLIKTIIPGLATKHVPTIVALCGGVLGGVGMYINIPGFIELNLYDAIATGIFSGIMSAGLFSWYKNITGQYEGND